MSRPKNQACPACKENGHDSAGDHLYLAAANDNWICSKVQYHEGSQYFIVPNNPETNEPIFPGEEEVIEKVPERPATIFPSEDDTLDSILFGSSAEGNVKVPMGLIEVKALPAVDFRGIPEATRSKYGVHHELSTTDRSVVKVFYPIFEKGVLVKWKERNVAEKKFYVKEIS